MTTFENLLIKILENGQTHIDSIISDCKKGDRRAQELFYKCYYDAMMKICLRYTKNDEDAVEVINDGFLKIFRSINNYKIEYGGIYTWIRKIMINSCLDFLKAKHRIENKKDGYVLHEGNIEPEVLEKYKAEALLEVIRKLPPATMVVFNLFVIDGLSHKEIAVSLNISEGTSKWHLSEGRQLLQKMLQQKEVKVYE
jgi:RNA polymerase sigma factor (sigma-70 family)